MAAAASEGGEARGHERCAGWLLGLRELVGRPAATRWQDWPAAVRWWAEQAEPARPSSSPFSFSVLFSFFFI